MPIVTPVSVLEELGSARERTVNVYDFRRPATLAREHSRVIEAALETFARQWGTQLTAKIRLKSVVRMDGLDLLSYDDYATSVPATTAVVLCEIAGTEPRLVIQFPAAAGLSWLNRMLGGSTDPAMPERAFTQLEQALIQRLLEETLEDLQYSMGPLLSQAVTIEAIQYNSRFAQAAAPTEPMVVARFSISVGATNADATLAIPAEVLLAKLQIVSPAEAPAGARERIHAQMEHVPVELAVQLARTTVTPQQILNLAVGDILPLPHLENRPFDVELKGTRLATAAPARNGARAAAVIVTIEEHQP